MPQPSCTDSATPSPTMPSWPPTATPDGPTTTCPAEPGPRPSSGTDPAPSAPANTECRRGRVVSKTSPHATIRSTVRPAPARVVGLDYSLTSTGVATTPPPKATLIRPRTKGHARLQALKTSVTALVPHAR